MSQLITQNKYLFILTLVGSFFLSSCSKAFRFNSSTIVPAASGKVFVHKDKNKNYEVKITVSNLADPKNLIHPGSLYVVWVETVANGTKNLGQLNVSKSILAAASNATLTAITPFTPKRIFITAEESAKIAYPGSSPVLETDNMK